MICFAHPIILDTAESECMGLLILALHEVKKDEGT